ncbi:MAG: alpha/beta fold hydrolase [Solirubrobacteraceae bacterium]
MQGRRIAAVAGALIVLAVVSLLLTGCGAQPKTAVQGAGVASGVPVPRLRWMPCGAGFECATAKVPLDYDKPHAETISLALIRLPATDRARRIGTLFIGPGGPGGSGVEFLRDLGGSLFAPEARCLPRRSARALTCSASTRGESAEALRFATAKRAAAARPPYAFPVGERQEQAWLASDRAVARDLELLRRAVGDRHLTYAGFSYGTYIGETYANLFPRRVRALVLDGVVDPVAWSTGRGDQARTVPVTLRVRAADGYHRALRLFFALCTRAGAACAFSHGNPRARWERLARRLRGQSMRLPDGRTFTYRDLLLVTYGPMSEPSLWPQLAKWLQAIDTGNGPLPPAIPAFYDPARLAVICADSDNPASADAWQRAAAAADRRLLDIGRAAAWEPSICRAWRALDTDRYTGPWTRRTSHPVLLAQTATTPKPRPSTPESSRDCSRAHASSSSTAGGTCHWMRLQPARRTASSTTSSPRACPRAARSAPWTSHPSLRHPGRLRPPADIAQLTLARRCHPPLHGSARRRDRGADRTYPFGMTSHSTRTLGPG